MEPPPAKPSTIRSLLIRALLFGVAVLLLRFVYVVSVHGASCDLSGDFCLFSSPAAVTVPTAVASLRLGSASSPSLWSSREYRRAVDYYSAVFQDLVVEDFLSPTSKSLVLDSPAGHEVLALKEIGVADSIAISKKKSPPLVVSGDLFHQPFGNNSFDFIFAGRYLDRPVRPADLAGEISRILKPEGFLVVLTSSAGDLYSLRSLQDLFPSFQTVRSREIDGPDSSLTLREVVLRKEIFEEENNPLSGGNTVNNNCSVAEHKLEIIRSAEPLIEEEPLKPWITLKKNAQKIKYLPSVADISFKQRYVYIDVGARSYGSSIGSWFKKQYPKQNRTFEVYAIEADKAFYPEYKLKKGINLIPFAAWVRNESLSFEVNHEPDPKSEGRGMGRIKPSNGGKSSSADVHAILGFDFAEWLRSTVTERDFVVMKMDVEGTEFDLIPRLFETGAICLIDELFLECHYNRWQRCCPGVRSPKYQYTYGQCLDLFSSLRSSGVLVHQWW